MTMQTVAACALALGVFLIAAFVLDLLFGLQHKQCNPPSNAIAITSLLRK
jgi:hypothetical protein